MRPEDLQSYIARFREWLDLHAAPVLQSGHSAVVTNWREELGAAERLLEQKPELPIAFIGPSQQGKSSLINAIVGETILAVGGAVGACTCVITSVHHHTADNFRAEIEFISFRDWAAELAAIRHAATAGAVNDDTDLDREEKETNKKSALEKFSAVYHGEPLEHLPKILSDVNLGLPKEIVFAMAKGRSLIITEDKAISLRNKVRRYLVGREQHEEGQFWPLISRVRIYGNFKVLSNGVVLVDLPGLNDPNPAREHVTRKYLEEARYLWLVCNSQTGIDRVFTQVLRENGFLFRLFLEGRLDVFSVVATRIDDMNVEAVLTQMGRDSDDFDGHYAPLLQFRRKEIAAHVQRNLIAIAEDIGAKAEAGSEHRSSFFHRVKSIPVFSISTNGYLHAMERMPHYHGIKFSPEETHVPNLIEHLNSVTLEQSYKTQVEASLRRLRMLHEQAKSFFLNAIRRIEEESEQARAEWTDFVRVADCAIEEGREALKTIRTRSEEALKQRCLSFEQELTDLDARAARGLNSVFAVWNQINWRSLRSAVEHKGVWFSVYLRREFHLNRDIARAYLDLVPFIWDEFFGVHLARLTEDVVNESKGELHKTAERLKGAMDMLRFQPAGIRESIETSLRTAGDSFQLRSGEVRTALSAQIQRTRQALATGMVEAASAFMQPAYSTGANFPVGTGIKKRMLEAIVQHAKQHAPKLFINIRQELTEGVAVLQTSIKPQHSRIVDYGASILDHFQRNMTTHRIVTPEQRGKLQIASSHLPQPVMSQ
jgi:hypothetical protein